MKKLNYNFKKIKKRLIIVIVLLIFLSFICSTLILMNRKYLLFEMGFKNISSKINSYIVSNLYSIDKINENVLLSKINYLKKENNDLRKTVMLENKNDSYLVSEVVNHTIKNWFNKLEISKGYNDGIKKNDVVISNNGLVGFISKVSKNVSEVKLITDIDDYSLLSVSIETNNGYVTGILRSYDKDNNMFKITDITSKNTILEGDKVILSGYDKSSYNGIYIGKVVKEEINNYGLNKNVWLKSEVDFNDLLFLTVIKEDK